MNDFTKEELESLNHIIMRAYVNCQLPKKTQELQYKIQSMINNYYDKDCGFMTYDCFHKNGLKWAAVQLSCIQCNKIITEPLDE